MSAVMATKSTCPSSDEEFELRRGPWTLEEDTILIHYITSHGEGRWNSLAKCAGLKRTGKSCRLRWLNYLKPDIKRGNLTPQEQLLILELHYKWGNRWSKIAQHLPGRTDNEIKNYWRTRVQKQARHLKIDSNSKRFVEALRRFWMPRLLEKIGQSSSPTTSSSSLSSTPPMEIQDPTTPRSVENFQTPFAVSNNFNHGTENSSPISISSADFMSKTELPKNTEHHTSPTNGHHHHAYGNTAFSTSLVNDCYYVDISSFDMEGFNQHDMSALGYGGMPIMECQMAEFDWSNDDEAGALWNMDELWEFRN